MLLGGCCCGVLAAHWVLLSLSLSFCFSVLCRFVSCLLVVFCGLLIVFITRCFWANVPSPWLFVALQLDGSKRAGYPFRSDFASGCLPSTFAAWAKAQPVLLVHTERCLLYQMSIIGEVQITKMHCIQQFTQDNGLTEIQDIDCWISGSAQGTVRVRVSIHARFATFDDELITLMCGHFAHPSNYTGIFAPSCGSIGDFTDIKQYEDGITPQMRNFNFPVRRLNGNFYARVYPFDPKFYHKAHPTGTLLFSGFHSHLTLLQYLCIHLPVAKRPIHILSEVPKYWLEEDGTLCLDENHRWRSDATLAWRRVHGLYSVPRTIKEEIGVLVYNRDRSRASNDMEPPPGL